METNKEPPSRQKTFEDELRQELLQEESFPEDRNPPRSVFQIYKTVENSTNEMENN